MQKNRQMYKIIYLNQKIKHYAQDNTKHYCDRKQINKI